MNVLVRKTLVQQVRGIYRAATSWKDVLDNPFYDKYKKQLEAVQGSESLLKERSKGKAIKSQNQTTERNLQQRADLSSPPPVSWSHEDLNEVMKVELIAHKSGDEISQIWVDYHKTKDCISAIVPGDTYLQLQAKALHCPMFVYPLPRSEGYEMWLSQFAGHKCYFTSLINYQMFQENAPHSLTLTHYIDLLDSKGLVLVRGEVDLQHLTTLEAQNLTNQMQLYYASQRADLFAMVREFNHNPQHFDYKQLIEQFNSFSL